MKGYTGVLANGEAIHYVDRKRWLWLLSVAYPLQPLLAIWLHFKTGNELWFLLPLVVNYVIAPLVDWAIGEDSNNPPEEVVMQLDQDLYYRRLTYAVVPLHFITLIACVWYATEQPLSWWGFVLLAVIAGMTAGLAINTGHELGHKNSKFEKSLAKSCWPLPHTVTFPWSTTAAITKMYPHLRTRPAHEWVRVSTSSRAGRFLARFEEHGKLRKND